MKKLVRQFVKYFGVAAIGYAADIGIMVLSKEVFNLHYLISATIGFICGLIVVYILSGRYVFGESKLSSKQNEFVLFAAIGLIGLAILTVLMWLLTSNFNLDYILSKIFATIIVYIWNFFARRSLYHN